jgi:alkanesulfonate monooxygenase SsuD/methylene tetrahydromethanopterin reductase-like flavin-dependent oxidoreductase (luciferase family)
MSFSSKTIVNPRGMLGVESTYPRRRPGMRIGIGLPAAIPGVSASAVGDWAAVAEASGFESVGVIDRLVYDNLDPIVALAVAAERTERVELLTTVLNVPWRRNAVVLAKQLASLDRVSGGRLTAGLGLGGWPDDHEAVGPAPAATGAVMDEMLATMHGVWSGDVGHASAAIPALPPGRPRLLFGGFVEATFRRAARLGDGWIAPSFGYEALTTGVDAARKAWHDAGRPGQPRIVVERYFCLGDGADGVANHYLDHYYGPAYLAAVSADTATTVDHLEHELQRLADAGCDDAVLLPCDADVRQVELLAGAVDRLRVCA